MSKESNQSRKDQPRWNPNKNVQHKPADTGQRNVPSEHRGPQGQ